VCTPRSAWLQSPWVVFGRAMLTLSTLCRGGGWSSQMMFVLHILIFAPGPDVAFRITIGFILSLNVTILGE
jgi:hypothetical protein